MPTEHPNPYPHPTAEEVEAAPGDRAQKAARNIASRAFDGIPRRAFLLGDADHSPVVKGIVDLTTLCYDLIDEVDRQNEPDPISGDTSASLDPDGFGGIVRRAERIREALEDHRC